jgi:hypothetical protein
MARSFPITGSTFTEPDDWLAWLRDATRAGASAAR